MEVSVIKNDDREDIELLVFKSSNYYSNYIQNWDEEKVNELFKEDRKSLSFKILNKKKIIGVISYFMIPVLGKYYMEIMVNGNEETFLEAINKFKKVVQKKEKIYFLVEKESKKLKNLMKENFYLDRNIEINSKEYSEYAIFTRDYTYAVHSDYLTPNEITTVFTRRGNWRKYSPNTDKYPDFLYVDGKHSYSPEIYKKYKRVLLKNQVAEHKSITRKDQLYVELKDIASARKYKLENHQIDLNNIDQELIKNLFFGNKAWIFKPVSGWSGVGIEIFDNYKNFKNYLDSLYQQKFFNRLKEKNIWVLQEYITNPLLCKGRKFHMRIYYLVFEDKNYIYNMSQIYTAKDKFKKGDYDNKDIHDSHIAGSIPNLYFPDSLDIPQEKKNLILGNLIDLFQLTNLIKEYKCFDESKQCYELLGADVMITDDYQVKLIEVNTKIGYKTFKGSNFNANLIESELTTVIDTVFPPKNKIKPSDDYFFIPINRYTNIGRKNIKIY